MDADHNLDSPDLADLPPAGESIGPGVLFSSTVGAIKGNFGAIVGIFFITTTLPRALGVATNEWSAFKTRELMESGGFIPGSIPTEEMMRPLLMINLVTWSVLVLRVVAHYFATAAIVVVVVEHLSGGRASVRTAYRRGVQRLLVVLVVVFLAFVGVGCGSLLCIVPGVVLLCGLFLAVPIAVSERTNPIQALQQSWELSQGHKITVFVFHVLIGLGVYVPLFAFQIGVGLADGSLPGAQDPIGLVEPQAVAMRVVSYGADYLADFVSHIASAAFGGALYAKLRDMKAGVDADAVASVFA